MTNTIVFTRLDHKSWLSALQLYRHAKSSLTLITYSGELGGKSVRVIITAAAALRRAAQNLATRATATPHFIWAAVAQKFCVLHEISFIGMWFGTASRLVE